MPKRTRNCISIQEEKEKSSLAAVVMKEEVTIEPIVPREELIQVKQEIPDEVGNDTDLAINSNNKEKTPEKPADKIIPKHICKDKTFSAEECDLLASLYAQNYEALHGATLGPGPGRDNYRIVERTKILKMISEKLTALGVAVRTPEKIQTKIRSMVRELENYSDEIMIEKRRANGGKVREVQATKPIKFLYGILKNTPRLAGIPGGSEVCSFKNQVERTLFPPPVKRPLRSASPSRSHEIARADLYMQEIERIKAQTKAAEAEKECWKLKTEIQRLKLKKLQQEREITNQASSNVVVRQRNVEHQPERIINDHNHRRGFIQEYVERQSLEYGRRYEVARHNEPVIQYRAPRFYDRPPQNTTQYELYETRGSFAHGPAYEHHH